jgi:ATP-dependent Clp protease ATP-binding subunit ClpC
MMDRFTERAQNALRQAEQSAMELGHDYVGSEHLLLGLLRDSAGVGARALVAAGVTEEKVREKVGEISGAGQPVSVAPRGLTPRTKRILELSFAEARRMGVNYIGTEHILLGLLREGESVAVKIVRELGTDPARIYNEVVAALGSPSGQPGDVTGRKSASANTPTLNQFGRDLTVLAGEGKIDPVIGRGKEIERVIQILSRRTKTTPA